MARLTDVQYIAYLEEQVKVLKTKLAAEKKKYNDMVKQDANKFTELTATVLKTIVNK